MKNGPLQWSTKNYPKNVTKLCIWHRCCVAKTIKLHYNFSTKKNCLGDLLAGYYLCLGIHNSAFFLLKVVAIRIQAPKDNLFLKSCYGKKIDAPITKPPWIP